MPVYLSRAYQIGKQSDNSALHTVSIKRSTRLTTLVEIASSERTQSEDVSIHICVNDGRVPDGCGAQLGHLSIHELWTNSDRSNHTNYLELKIVLFALPHWIFLFS